MPKNISHSVLLKSVTPWTEIHQTLYTLKAKNDPYLAFSFAWCHLINRIRNLVTAAQNSAKGKNFVKTVTLSSIRFDARFTQCVGCIFAR
jgi:hypothetical protein